ncbi:MAG: 16S rRNA (cytosine(1402)-N(4))-methyltransferase, partial [Lachnospiraceae bacterium]|nr:16S rRNA (cytosine(1402)-N(4))-methyltransferase [Lachnospiraceae bacterium]
MEFQHKPVMLNEVIDSLKIRPEGTYVDGTL